MPTFDLVCLSHLRWNYVFQRPHHLMTRFARERRVFFFEELVASDDVRLEVEQTDEGVFVAKPYGPVDTPRRQLDRVQQTLLDELMVEYEIEDYALWFYAPMAASFTRHLTPVASVYDCMDELSSFANPPAGLRERERELFERVDVVFTGGRSLYEAKRALHPSVHCFPSSVDVAHFARAREAATVPFDLDPIASPRLGYAGVIDERIDHDLVASVAAARPGWQFVMLGPISEKISADTVARGPNIHYLGAKRYDELPVYLAAWDVGLMPFALNEATRFISPTKTPEYLAAGLPVVSTPIRDVVTQYAERALVEIASTPDAFIDAVDRILRGDRPSLGRVDEHLARNSWDATWSGMAELLDEAVAERVEDDREGAIVRSGR